MKTGIPNSKMMVALLIGMAFAYSMTYVLLGHFALDPATLSIGAMIGMMCRFLHIMVTDFTSHDW